jgi:hypothetical protein
MRADEENKEESRSRDPHIGGYWQITSLLNLKTETRRQYTFVFCLARSGFTLDLVTIHGNFWSESRKTGNI